MALSHDDVREILEIIDSSGPSEIQVQTDGFSLHVVIGDRAAAGPVSAPPASAAPVTAPAAAPVTRPATAHLAMIESPMLGTFYGAEAPGAPSFVELGSAVEPDTVVCIIEVMKMMNSVTAGVTGTIVEIRAQNAQLVEYGEPLFGVEPA